MYRLVFERQKLKVGFTAVYRAILWLGFFLSGTRTTTSLSSGNVKFSFQYTQHIWPHFSGFPFCTMTFFCMFPSLEFCIAFCFYALRVPSTTPLVHPLSTHFFPVLSAYMHWVNRVPCLVASSWVQSVRSPTGDEHMNKEHCMPFQ